MSKHIVFEHDGKEYDLEYTLYTASNANADGFVLDEVGDKPALMIPKLVYWAFNRHHKGITRKQTEAIYAEIKQKQKELAQELLNGPDPVAGAQRSTVVVTNPTHLAIGLRYVPDEMPLPQVVCRGADQIAEMIKAAAREAGIPVMENVPLARALYKECRIDDYIPEALVEPVVEVLKVVRDLEKARQEEEELSEISVEDPE